VTSTTQVANLHASQVTGSVDVSSDTLTTSSAQKLAIIQGGAANVDIGAYSLTAATLVSDITTGTAPLTVASTTQVANLHASQVTGSVDGIIGGNAPASGTFTTLTASGDSGTGLDVTANATIGCTLIVNSLQINDTSANNQYIIGVSEITANRTITLPLLSGDDEFTFNDNEQILTNKTITDLVISTTTVPLLSNSTGTLGQLAFNTTHMYIYTNGWKSIALTSLP
jgi:hypothetical protein